MKTVNVHEAKTNLSKILAEVERGEEYILARAGKPIARLSPIRKRSVETTAGKWAGRVTISPDFDAEDDRIMEMFEGRGP
jgi:prevent-host-death family protein